MIIPTEELEYDGLFDLTLFKRKNEELHNRIATEGLSTSLFTVAQEQLPIFDTVDVRRLTVHPSSTMTDVALEAFDSAMSFLPTVRVHEDNGVITVTGIPCTPIMKHIMRNSTTSKVKNAFLDVGMRWFTCYSFYAIEVIYLLDAAIHGRNVPANHKNIMRTVISRIRENTWVKNTTITYPSRFDYSKLSELTLTLLPNQMKYLQTYDLKTQQYSLNGYCLASPPGTGKALKNGTPVKTPDGWTAIDQLMVGDVVMGQDGKPTNVLGVYHHKQVNMYRLTFHDGREIFACEDHQWMVHDGSNKDHSKRWAVIDSKEIARRFTLSKVRLKLPLCKPVESAAKDLMLDPYLMGALLGDGSYTRSAVSFNKNDIEMVKEFRQKLAPYGLKVIKKDKTDTRVGWAITAGRGARAGDNHVTNVLKHYGLMGKRSEHKFVPEDYLNGSIEQRTAVLQGLMDTDGTVDHRTGTVSFCSMSLKLAENVQYLVRSLGGIAKITEKKVKYQYKEDPDRQRIAYIVTIRHTEQSIFFKLPRKKRFARDTQYSHNLGLTIKSIEPAGKMDATCISVDNKDKLFITKDFVVTHNTITGYAMYLVSRADVGIFIVPNNSVDDVWEDTLQTRFKNPGKYSYWTSHMNRPITGKEQIIIAHYEALQTVLDAMPKFGNKSIYVHLDESHNFNELTSARTQRFIDMCTRGNMIASTWASGTPFKAFGKEAVPMMRCIANDFTQEVERKFIKMFGASKGSALDVLANRMGLVMFKVDKATIVDNGRNEYVVPVGFRGANEYTLDKIAADMVSFITERVKYYEKERAYFETEFLTLIDKARARIKDPAVISEFSLYMHGVKEMHRRFQPVAHRQLVVECKQFEREYIYPILNNAERKQFKKVASVYKYVALVIRGEALGRILTRARIDCFKEMVEHTNFKDIIETARKKTLIFTSYVEVADAIVKKVADCGFEPLVVYGDTNKNLPAIMQKFKTDPSANPLVATFDSLSTAVPVIDASTVVLFNAPFRDYIRDQAISRADRLGQDGMVDIANVILDTGDQPNISTRSHDILQWSKEQVDQIMGFTVADDENLVALEYFNDNCIATALPLRIYL